MRTNGRSYQTYERDRITALNALFVLLSIKELFSYYMLCQWFKFLYYSVNIKMFCCFYYCEKGSYYISVHPFHVHYLWNLTVNPTNIGAIFPSWYIVKYFIFYIAVINYILYIFQPKFIQSLIFFFFKLYTFFFFPVSHNECYNQNSYQTIWCIEFR